MPLLPFIAVVIILAVMPIAGPAQEYVYKQYGTRDGLGNSTVYEMLQDRDGFLWFATNSGISRFDGNNFQNFSRADGLPSNSILRIFEDSRGRIWLMPFRNAICYYYNGKIYNQENDSLLRKIKLGDYVRAVVENKNKELLLTDSEKLYHIDTSNNVRLIGEELSIVPAINQITVDESGGGFNVRFGSKIYATDTEKFWYVREAPEINATLDHLIVQDKISCWMDGNSLCVESSYNKKPYRQLIGSVNRLQLLNDSILCMNTSSGTIFYNLLRKKIEDRFLTGGNVSSFLVDKEGGYWFSTLNDGVFRLGSPTFKNITGQTAAGQKLGVYHLEKFRNEIWAACDMSHLLKVTNNEASRVPLTVNGEGLGSHLVYSLTGKGDRFAAVTGSYVFVKGKGDQFTHLVGTGSGKALAWKSDRELIIASSDGLYTLCIEPVRKIELHWPGRTTSLFYRNDSTWFGTFDGLYLMKPDKSIIFLGKEIPLLNVHIVSIREGKDGTIWVATDGSGLVGLQNNSVRWHFGKHNGLSGDRIRCVGVDSGFVWVGTAELSKISLQANPVITRYTEELNSDVINTVLVDRQTVYAGTNNGVSWFDKNATFTSSLCNLKLLGVSVNGEESEMRQSYFLPYKNNSIRFDYVGISMKSGGNIVYHYRLNGLDTAWKSTTQSSLELISLPPGEYKLELYAVNKFDVKSPVYSVDIAVQNPFWKSGWFMAGAIVLASLIAWFVGTRHNRALIKKEKMRRQAGQQLLELEQKALRAQMNPHFIFNCLNSIQAFILDNDSEKANKYISRFASLIRQTLENSLHSFISLADEIEYLTTYLQLEQMRSEPAFEYRIVSDANVPPDAVTIPVMILQPFVENAVRHGVQNVDGRTGTIGIAFSTGEQELVCRVEDNGIGRQQAELKRKSAQTLHQSRGMQLTYERIELLNTSSVKKITVEIVDKINAQNKPEGTEVIIRFPIFADKASTLS